MNCKNTSDLLIEYLKGELENENSLLIESHLKVCETCNKELHLLRNAFCELQNFNVIEIPGGVAAIAEKARKRAESNVIKIRSFWVTFATGFAALAIFFAINHKPTQIQNIAKKDNPAVNIIIPDKKKFVVADKKNPDKKNIKTNNTIISNHKITSFNKKRKVIHHIIKPNKIHDVQPVQPAVTEQQNDSVLLARINSLSQYLLLKDDKKTINCSIIPVIADDDNDQAVADTITAVLICKFRDEFGVSSVNRTTNINTSNVDHDKTFDDVDHLKDNYLIIGSITKSKSGYLLKVDIINRSDNSIVNTNNHPMLIPADSFIKIAIITNNNRIS